MQLNTIRPRQGTVWTSWSLPRPGRLLRKVARPSDTFNRSFLFLSGQCSPDFQQATILPNCRLQTLTGSWLCHFADHVSILFIILFYFSDIKVKMEKYLNLAKVKRREFSLKGCNESFSKGVKSGCCWFACQIQAFTVLPKTESSTPYIWRFCGQC